MDRTEWGRSRAALAGLRVRDFVAVDMNQICGVAEDHKNKGIFV
jgi:hypothetical protein